MLQANLIQTAKTYIILLNYNNASDTIECIKSVFASNYLDYKLIVVDNASSDNSAHIIKEWLELNSSVLALDEDNASSCEHSNHNVVFIQAKINGGFSAGNNIGIRYAMCQNDFEYIWLLNNDTIILPTTLGELARYAKQNDLGLTGSKLIYYDTDIVQAYGGGFINRYFATSKDAKDFSDKLDYICGASMLISKAVIDTVGLLPREYFLYCEDSDYSISTTRLGFKIGCAFHSIVYHKEGATTNGKDKTNMNPAIDYLSVINRLKLAKKFGFNIITVKLGLIVSAFIRIKRGRYKNAIQIIKFAFMGVSK